MRKSFVTKEELNKFDRMMIKRGFIKIANRFYNPGTKVSVSVNQGIAVWSYRSEITECLTVREYITAHAKKRRSKKISQQKRKVK